jgi:YebC/PmpR family DNA-binding regulatory protein
MSGHSHWARIKRAKSVTDARRGRLWSKLARAVIVAARHGGADPEMNLALRYAIDAAKDANMPKDTIDRAVKKGSGAGGTEEYVELVFEGYGPGGAAILCTALTDNRNRTAPEVKKIFETRGGNLGAANCVAWMFKQRGVFVVSRGQADEETLTNLALESGADDLIPVGDEAFELHCEAITLAGAQAEKMMRLIDALEDHDDVQKVHTNFEMSEADMQRLSQ